MKMYFRFFITFLALAGMAVVAQAQAGNKAAELANRFFNAPSSPDPVAVLNEILDPYFFSEHFPGPGGSGKPEYVEGIRAFLSAFPDLKITVLKQFSQDNQVFSYGFLEGTHKGNFMGMPATGNKIHVHFMDIWTEQYGKLIYNEVVMDVAGLMAQLKTGATK